MTAQVIFINHLYRPDDEETKRRERLQDEINSYHIKIFDESKRTKYPIFYYRVYKDRLHQEMRKKIKLVFRRSLLAIEYTG